MSELIKVKVEITDFAFSVIGSVPYLLSFCLSLEVATHSRFEDIY